MAEGGLRVSHQHLGAGRKPVPQRSIGDLRGAVRPKSSTWHVNETFVRRADRWIYPFRAVDGQGYTLDFYLSETRDREAAT